MALIYCTECGKQMSDKAKSCPNCGCPNSDYQEQPQKEQSILEEMRNGHNGEDMSVSNKKQSPLGITALALTLLVVTYGLGLVIAIVDLIVNRKDNRKHTCSKIAIVLAVIFLIPSIFSDSDTEETTQTQESTQVSQEEIIETTIEETVVEEVVPVLTEEEYMELCSEPVYKDLVRYPEEHIGDYIKLELEVSQVIDKGFFDDYKSYRCYSKSEYGYWGDEYYILDARETDSTKIIEDDIIIIYGQYKGTSDMLRSITFTSDEVATIEAKYIDITTK